MKISQETLRQLTENKLCQAGLKHKHTVTAAGALVYTGTRGIHSHGAVRVEYYVKYIPKGGTNRKPKFHLKETGPCSATLYADNTAGQVAMKMGTKHAIKAAQQRGAVVVGISRMGHSGAISYFVQQAARAGLIGISLCQSDPTVVPLGGAEIYYGTNPLVFVTPGEGDETLTFDMATIAQVWGKVSDARSRSIFIPDTRAVNKNGAPTANPSTVHALLPAARPKRYGLTMMINVPSGILLGLPFGRRVNSMCDDLHTGRSLG